VLVDEKAGVRQFVEGMIVFAMWISAQTALSTQTTIPSRIFKGFLIYPRQRRKDLSMPPNRILCVEDDADTRDLLKTMLGFSDFEAVVAPDVDASG